MKYVSYAVLIICLAVLLMPLYIMTIGSFTNMNGFMRKPPSLILHNPTMKNYRNILAGSPIILWAINSVIVAGATMALGIGAIIFAGYCVSRYPGRIVSSLYVVFLLGVMVPKNALILPMFVLIKNLGLSSTLAAVILPSVFYPVGLFIYKNYMDKLPKDFDDSARMDGASEWTIITRVLVPMARPVIAALCTFMLMESLREFMWQFLMLQRRGLHTLIVGLTLKAYNTQLEIFRINPIGLKMAAGMIIFVPLAMIYFFLHRYYLEGLTTGGIKA